MTYFDFGSQPRPIYVSVVRYIHILRKPKDREGGFSVIFMLLSKDTSAFLGGRTFDYNQNIQKNTYIHSM